jgi:DNA-binding SARP family transcriptional activator/tetratricopeptide (TPR) repeat protein
VSIHLSLLGGFSVRLDSQEVTEAAFARRKARSLLKLLALRPGYRLHRYQAMDLLWPGLSPRGAAAQLYKAVHHVRQAFATVYPELPPETLLEIRGEVLSLKAPGGIHTDVEEFEELAQAAIRDRDLNLLQRAVADYRGDLLPTDLYEEWTVEYRDVLRERFLELLVKLGEDYVAAGYPAEAGDVFRQVLTREPTREEAHRGLMRVYSARGSTARALHQYRLCKEILVDELGVDPSNETTRLYQDILRGEVKSLHLPNSLPSTKPIPLPPLAGRRSELETISTLLERLGSGEGSVLGIEGSTGIGKTRLVQEILQIGRGKGYQVLIGHTNELEGPSPYTPFIEALRMALREDLTHAGLIPSELAVAIPELPPTAQPVVSADKVAAQNALFAGVLRFLAAWAQDVPVILILDDLHVADEGSLKLFHYLARQASSQALLLVGTWRPHEPGAAPALETAISSLERQNLLHLLTLAPLSKTEHRALLEQVLKGSVDDRLTNEIYRISEGNPLFASEIAHQLATTDQISLKEGMWRIAKQETLPLPPSLQTLFGRYPARLSLPPSLQTLLNRHLRSISPAALQLLQLAAVVGREVSFPVLQADTGRDREPTSLLDVLDELLDARLLEETGLSYRFPHPLLREAVYQQMSEVRRRALHGRVARALEMLYRDDPEMPVEAVAYHYLQVGEVEQAVGYLIRAGDRAEAVYAHDDALLRYEEALSLLEEEISTGLLLLSAEVQERVGDVHRATGDVARSVEAYRTALEALTLANIAPSEGPQSTLHRKIALGAILTTDMATASEHLGRAREMLGPDSLEEARLLIAQSLFEWHRNALEEAVQHALQALEIAEAGDAQVEITQACEMLALAYLPLGNWEEGLKYELRRQVTGWSPDVVVATDGHLCLWEYHVHGDDPYQKAQEFIETVAEHATAVGDLRCVAVCHYALGSMAFLRGHLEPAAQNLARGLELNRRIGSSAGVAYTLARQASLMTAQGDAETGWKLVQQGLEVARQTAVWDHCLQRLYGTGIWNRLEVGDLSNAGELVETAKRMEEERRMCTVCGLQLYPALASFQLASGDLETAWAYTEKAQQLAEAGQNRAGEAQVLRVRGEIHAARGDPGEARACLARAADIFRELDQRYDLARTLRIWGNLPIGTNPETQRGGRAQPR